MIQEERISKHFTWHELVYSETAERKQVDNIPGREEIKAISFLVTALLQPLRERYKKPILITSGYRCPAVNRLVGGVPGSQHTKGEAADCRTEDNDKLLQVLLESGLEFDQAIVYHKQNFIHLSLKRQGKNRKQILWK